MIGTSGRREKRLPLLIASSFSLPARTCGNTVPTAIGLAGIPCTRIENACPSGSDAFRVGAMAVASGVHDLVLVIGVEKMRDKSTEEGLLSRAAAGHPIYTRGETAPVLFAPFATRHMHEFGTTAEQLAEIKVAELRLKPDTTVTREKAMVDAINDLGADFKAKVGALQAHQVAQDAVKATLDLVAKAPVGKDRAAVEAIKSDVEALKASLNQVQLAIDKEDYLSAQTQSKAIQEKSQAVSAEIQNALAKVGKGKPSAAKKK